MDEKLLRTDPSGKIDAVVVECGGDATVATPTQVFVAPKGQTILPDATSLPVLVADHAEKAELVWPSSGRLQINLKGGRVYRHMPLDQPSGVVVEVNVDGVKNKPKAIASPGPQP